MLYLLAVTCILLWTASAFAKEVCEPYPDFRKLLGARGQLVWMGLSPDGLFAMELWMNPTSWTLVQHDASGLACIKQSGQDWSFDLSPALRLQYGKNYDL